MRLPSAACLKEHYKHYIINESSSGLDKSLYVLFLSDRRIPFCIIAIYITLCTVRKMYFVFETGEQMVSCNAVIARIQPNAIYLPNSHHPIHIYD